MLIVILQTPPSLKRLSPLSPRNANNDRLRRSPYELAWISEKWNITNGGAVDLLSGTHYFQGEPRFGVGRYYLGLGGISSLEE